MYTQLSALKGVYALVLLIIFDLIGLSEATAQRTMRYQNLLTFEFVSPVDSRPKPGGVISYGQYTLDGLWRSDVSVRTREYPISTGGKLELITIGFEGDYMHRIFATRSRSISLYGGGGAFLGYEIYDPFGRLPQSIDIKIGDGAFVYGIKASMEAEIFIISRLAMVMGIDLPMTFSSAAHWLRTEGRIGLRINI